MVVVATVVVETDTALQVEQVVDLEVEVAVEAAAVVKVATPASNAAKMDIGRAHARRTVGLEEANLVWEHSAPI